MLLNETVLLLWMAAYSLAWVLTEATILQEPRNWLFGIDSTNVLIVKTQQLLSCIYCTSFWTGLLFFSYVAKTPITNIIYAFSTITIVFFIERALYIKED